MPTDDESLYERFGIEAGASSMEAIDDAVLSERGRRLDPAEKSKIAGLMCDGFTQVVREKTIGKIATATAACIYVVIDGEASDTDAPEALAGEDTS
jgi:hypothetical protein